ncbi:protein phosphatase regulator [Tilletia horrida]|nr:protein phosphatase regulator [Tilletia horrida]
MSDDSVAQFCDVTGASADAARSALAAANNDVSTAIANHFATQEAAQEGADPSAAAGGGEDEDLAQALQESADAGSAGAASQPQGPFSSTDPWDHTASSSNAPVRGGPTGFRTPAAGLGGASSGGSSRNTPAATSSSRPPGGIHTFRDLAGGGGNSGNSGGGNRIRTFRDLASGNDGASVGGSGGGFPGMGGSGRGSDDDEPMDDPVNFYTGGERSGLSVQNPDHLRRRPQAPNDLVGNILKQAAEAGVRRPAGSGGEALPATGAPSSAAFAGSGRTLASSSDDTAEGQANAASADAAQDQAPEELPTAIRYLTFWANGYTLADEGPLRSYEDPHDAAVLRAIQGQRAPLEVMGVQPNQPVELRVVKKLGEKWSPPPPGPTRAFEGSGQRLGAPVPGDAGPSGFGAAPAPTASTTTSISTSSNTGAVPLPASEVDFQVDRSQPTTQIQVRLAEGGERIVATLNHTHTVGDLRRYLDASRPGMAARPYTLHASFPPKPLPSDETVTIKDAGLLSAVVIQRWA